MSYKAVSRLRGHCLCGDCMFELAGAPNWVGHCHCESCRRATASPFTTWLGQENGRWRFLGQDPVVHTSSPGNRRGFCGTCGSPLFYESDRFPNEVHFYVALLDTPEVLSPGVHYHSAEMLPWIHMDDGLPRR
ncbi:GFA family protein [Chachezhania antarctica]|uniref:GFA family protein n=1 Tax=Chachezhania antarctica TaxID=2340860 RepID=UPI000EB1CF2C|nr:GFA family protein [Chachezhania antarctica]|tara:strand:- start:4756 stop:5154 length:399 start_codon:yes stop_codon:yes gene_type:complete